MAEELKYNSGHSPESIISGLVKRSSCKGPLGGGVNWEGGVYLSRSSDTEKPSILRHGGVAGACYLCQAAAGDITKRSRAETAATTNARLFLRQISVWRLCLVQITTTSITTTAGQYQSTLACPLWEK